jgi:hypothetical protein
MSERGETGKRKRKVIRDRGTRNGIVDSLPRHGGLKRVDLLGSTRLPILGLGSKALHRAQSRRQEGRICTVHLGVGRGPTYENGAGVGWIFCGRVGQWDGVAGARACGFGREVCSGARGGEGLGD